MNREELIEEAAKALHRAAWGEDIAEPADPDYMAEMRRQAEMVLAAFEKVHAKDLAMSPGLVINPADSFNVSPTDDEREALARLFDAHWMTPLGKCACGWVHPQYGMRASHLDPIYVRQHLAYVVSNAGYRRSEVPEPSAAREFLKSALAESDANVSEGGAGWDVEVDARTVLELLDEVPEPQGEPSDAQVLAALDAFYRGESSSLSEFGAMSVKGMRAALRAAGGVR